MNIDYIMGLKEPLTIEDLRPLIGQELKVRDMTMEWGKEVLTCDKMVITHIKINMTIGKTKDEAQAIRVYSDYWLGGRNKFNAWTSLKGIQNYIKAADNEN